MRVRAARARTAEDLRCGRHARTHPPAQLDAQTDVQAAGSPRVRRRRDRRRVVHTQTMQAAAGALSLSWLEPSQCSAGTSRARPEQLAS